MNRLYWINLKDLESPGAVSSLYSRQTPPEEPGHWVRVELAEVPGEARVIVTPSKAA